MPLQSWKNFNIETVLRSSHRILLIIWKQWHWAEAWSLNRNTAAHHTVSKKCLAFEYNSAWCSIFIVFRNPLFQLQPAYPGNTDNWYLALSQLANRDKHHEHIRYSQYHIPIILNGNKGIAPIPRGLPVFGDPTVHQGQHPKVQYELCEVVDIARKAAIQVEKIVAEFHRHM